MEEQTDAPKQAPSGEKIFDELPTFVAPVTTALGGAVGEQATRYDLNDNFSIFKVGDQQKPPEEAAQKNLDFSNPDAFVIGQPPTQNYVHLDFDLDPLASSATVSTPPQASTAITKANLLDDDLDDWSTEAHKQPIISATEQSSFTEPPKPLEQVGVNVTNIMETSCIDNLLADLPEETDEEEDEASNRSSNNNNQNDSDWYLKETHVKEKESSSFLHEESIVTTSNVVFEPSEPEAVSLPPSSGSPDRPQQQQQQQQQFTYGDTSLESSLRTSTEVKEMSFEESSSLWSTSSVTQTTTTAITGEPQEPQQQQPNSPVTSESGAPKSSRSRPSQPPPPPPPATMSSSSSSDLDDGHRGGGAQKSPEQSEQNKPAELWTFDSPAAGSGGGGQAAETTIASASSSSFFSSAAPVVTETVTAAVLPPLPSSPPSWSTSAAPVAPVATTAVADNTTTTTARQASVDDDVSNSSSSSYPQEEQQPTSAEAIFSSLGSSFVPPSPPSVQLQSSTSAVPPPPPVPSVKEEEEVVVETKKKTESETLSWSPPSPVKEVPPKKEEVVVKQSPAFEAPKQQQLKSSSSSTTMGRKNRRDNSSDDGADHAAGSDQIREYIENVLGPNVAELVYWRDLKHSGAAFGLGLVLLFSLTFFSVISVVAYTLFFTLLASLSFRVYKNVMQAVQKTGEGHPFKEYLEIQITPSQERIHEIVESAIVHGTTFINRLRSVLLVEDIVDSLKYLVIFWAFTYIGAWFNGLTVIILLYLGAFSLPLLYEQNRPLIDQYLELANSKITEISDKVPFLKKAVAAAPAEKKDE